MGGVCPQIFSSSQQIEIDILQKKPTIQQNNSQEASQQVIANVVPKAQNNEIDKRQNVEAIREIQQIKDTSKQVICCVTWPKCSQCFYEDRVFVIRRQLSSTIKYKVIAHSGLLLKISFQYYILEYMQDGKTYLTKIDGSKVSQDSVEDNNYRWTKQKRGTKISQKGIFAQKVRQTMQTIMRQHSYNMLTHCCHVAQEAVRYYYRWAEITQLSYKNFIVQLKCPNCWRKFGQSLRSQHFIDNYQRGQDEQSF